jgi:mRNA-degrading endonuclease HigB of HigAB toxin-antitoxin module
MGTCGRDDFRRNGAAIREGHADSRISLTVLLAAARDANWEHFPALQETFPSADLGKRTGKLIVDIGGNKCRLIAAVSFETQELNIERVLTCWPKRCRRELKPMIGTMPSRLVSGNSSPIAAARTRRRN